MFLKNFFSSYKFILLSVVVFFLVFETIVVVGAYYSRESDLNDYLHTETIDSQIHTRIALLQMNRIAKILFDAYVNRPEVRKIMYAANHTKDKQKLAILREKLYLLLEPEYEYFKKNGVRQLHFHLPKAVSFLRFHKPKKFGDSLWNIRESIKYVNKHLTQISCYEEGRIFNGFRNVFPLFYKNQFLGTVEISYSFLTLQKELLAVDFSSYMFLVSKKVATKKLFKAELSHYEESQFKNFFYDKGTLQNVMELCLDKIFAINKEIAPKVQQRLAKGEIFSIYFSDKNIYYGERILISFIPVKNIDDQTVAYIIHYKFDKFLDLLLHKTNMLFAILTLLMLLISLMVMLYLIYYKKKQEFIEAQATHDALTKIYNRYGLNNILKQKMQEYQRYQKEFSIIFFDIDFFKKVNDTYGHDVGDYVLESLADIVSSEIRSSDAFGRWGGEEFIIILPETSLKQAMNVAEKLRKTVEKEMFGSAKKITCSFGVTTVRDTDNITTLLKRVDEYLYKAKENGRNSVVSDKTA